MASEGNPVVDTEKEVEVSIPGENKRLDTREDVADIVKSIEECDGLTTLRLSGNSLGVEAAKAIAEVLAHKPTLRRALWSDMFVSRLKSEIPPAVTALGEAIITSQAHLVELDLSDNAFGPAGMVAVNTLLTSPSCYSLKILKFNNTGMGIGGGKFLSKALLECHEEADKAGQRLALEVFVAGRNRLENEGAIALSEVFETLGTLLHVSMPQNGINPAGICAMAKAFSKNTKLQVIDLNDNTITEEGSTAMAEVLPNIQELRVVNFGDCLLRSGGAKAIVEALKDRHKLLEEVNLSYNELDQDAGLVVAEALSSKDELKKIELNGNCFGKQGIELLRESLEAKGRLDALGSLSDDEGEESDEEEEDVSTDEKLQVTVTPEKGSSSVTPDKGSSSVTPEKGSSSVTPDKGSSSVTPEKGSSSVTPDKGSSHAQESGPSNQAPEITLSEFLSCPSGENLLALGEERAQLIRELAGEHPEPQRVAELYAKISSSYTETCPNQVKKAVEETLDGLLQPFCEVGGVNELINELLVQLGLIKSEDKKFHPVKEVEGPLLALSYVVRQHYFPRDNGDILIFFLTKSSPILEPVTHIRHRVLQVLHTL